MDQVKIELPDEIAEVVIDGIDVSECYGPDGKLTEAETANEGIPRLP